MTAWRRPCFLRRQALIILQGTIAVNSSVCAGHAPILTDLPYGLNSTHGSSEQPRLSGTDPPGRQLVPAVSAEDLQNIVVLSAHKPSWQAESIPGTSRMPATRKLCFDNFKHDVFLQKAWAMLPPQISNEWKKDDDPCLAQIRVACRGGTKGGKRKRHLHHHNRLLRNLMRSLAVAETQRNMVTDGKQAETPGVPQVPAFLSHPGHQSPA